MSLPYCAKYTMQGKRLIVGAMSWLSYSAFPIWLDFAPYPSAFPSRLSNHQKDFIVMFWNSAFRMSIDTKAPATHKQGY
jgi:hypothetical protein